MRALAGFPLLIAATSVFAGVVPTDPVVGEPVMLSYVVCAGGGPIWFTDVAVKVSGSQVVLSGRQGGSDFSVPFCGSMTSMATGLAPGHYDAFVAITNAVDPSPRPLGSFTVSPRPTGVRPVFGSLSGNWFDPVKPGSGTNVVQGDSLALFAAVLGYDGSGLPTWTVMPSGTWLTPTRFRGVLYATSGTPANLSWKSADLNVSALGMFTLDFSSASEATFEVHPAIGVTTSQAVRRFSF